MKSINSSICQGDRLYLCCFAISVLLIVAGFFSPPIGQIDGSVLTAVGMLMLFATLDKLPEAIRAGRSIRIQKGDFSAEVSGEAMDE